MAQNLTKVDKVVIEYQYMTESYDRSLPHSISPRTGDSIVYPEQRRHSTNFSAYVRRHVMEILRDHSGAEIMLAMHTWGSYRFDRLAEVYHHLDEYILREELGRYKVWQGNSE